MKNNDSITVREIFEKIVNGDEDYISNLLSGPPSSQWKIPIIPSGKDKSSDSRRRQFEWVNLEDMNKVQAVSSGNDQGE